jgi:Phytanoyl-CoA dioxygenase (PhyH)
VAAVDTPSAGQHRQVFQDAALQQAFEVEGLVSVPMLSASEVAALREEVTRLRPDDNFAPDGSGRGPSYHCSFLDSNRDYRRRVRDLVGAVFAPHVASVLAGYEILNCNFYVKPPGTGKFTIHQNWPALADLDDTTVTIWCPLGDTDTTNGTLQVVPGSHKLLPHIEAPGAEGYFAGFTEALIAQHLKPIPVRAGDAIIFDDSLLHWSAANLSDSPRVAIQILCVPSDAMPVLFFRTSDTQFEIIEADSEFYLTNDASQLSTRQPHWRSVGTAPNRNRSLTYQQFVQILDAARMRRSGDAPTRRGLGDRVARWLGYDRS